MSSNPVTCDTIDDMFEDTIYNAHRLSKPYLIGELLMKHNWDVNKKNTYGRTLLSVACFHGYSESIEYLVNYGADVNTQDKYGNTPLMIIAEYIKSNFPMFKYLVEHGANVDIKNVYGENVLYHVFCNGEIEHIKYLIEQGIDINNRDNHGETVLFSAVKYITEQYSESFDKFKYLIEQGADISIRNDKNMSLLSLALLYDKPTPIKILYEHGAK